MVIRNAELGDAGDIAELTCQLGYSADAGVTRSRLECLFAREDQLVVVAIAEGRLCGWLQAHWGATLEAGFRVEIVGLVVSEASRRRSIGRKLVDAAEIWASEKGAEILVVRSNTKRIESHGFYPAMGFTMSKTQAVYRKPIVKRPNQSSEPTSMSVTICAEPQIAPATLVAHL
jgi:GNAT superfamily N-acetyltransferase